MSYTKEDRLNNPMPVQCDVAIGAMYELGPIFTSSDMAEALTLAQDYVDLQDRIQTPVTVRVAGQYLGYLRERGMIERIKMAPSHGGIGATWRIIEQEDE